MPVISIFYGLIICMYYQEGSRHKLPHIHVKYNDDEAVYSIPLGNLLAGSLPLNKQRLLQAWIEIHKEDLMTNWQLAVSGSLLYTIDPLK